jgi:rare lipoprotein A
LRLNDSRSEPPSLVGGQFVAPFASRAWVSNCLLDQRNFIRQRLFIGPGACLRKDKALKTRMVLLIISIVCLPLSPTNLLRASADEGAGIASIYSSDIGSETASGQKLNPEALTAAHRTLPFGTEVRVTNTNNRRSVLVIINDRGPFVRGRIIDLTPAAARALAFSGLAPVALDLTAPDDDR